MTLRRLFSCALTLLCLGGSALLVQPGHSQDDRGGPPGDFRRGPSKEEKERARLRIGMTENQQAQIDALLADADRQRRPICERLGELYRERHQNFEQYDFDRSLEFSLRREIGQLQNQLMQVHLKTEEGTRRILTREQFRRLRALMKEGFEKHRRPSKRGGRSFTDKNPS